MVSEIVDAVKNAEHSAMNKQKNAKKQAELIIENANKEAQSFIQAKIKEANAKAELRINFAKSSAEESLKENVKKYEADAKILKEKSAKLKDKIIKEVINLIIN